jgi:hypothetical protein
MDSREQLTAEDNLEEAITLDATILLRKKPSIRVAPVLAELDAGPDNPLLKQEIFNMRYLVLVSIPFEQI